MEKKRYMFIGGVMICSFLFTDNIYNYIPNMGNNLTPYFIAIVGENICFLTAQLKVIKKEKINDNELLKAKEVSVDPFDYHVSNCGKRFIKKITKM